MDFPQVWGVNIEYMNETTTLVWMNIPLTKNTENPAVSHSELAPEEKKQDGKTPWAA